jgi:protease II
MYVSDSDHKTKWVAKLKQKQNDTVLYLNTNMDAGTVLQDDLIKELRRNIVFIRFRRNKKLIRFFC